MYALDSSAILRLLDNEAGASEVRRILARMTAGNVGVLVCALHWGEVAGHLLRMKGAELQEQVLSRIAGLGIEIVPVSAERAWRAAMLQVELNIPYISAFGVELAEGTPCTFVTADYDVEPAAHRVQIQFLPSKYFRFETLPPHE